METATFIPTLLSILLGLVRDAEELVGLEAGSLSDDYELVANSVRSRGLRVLLVDFPSLCKDLERSLDSGKLLFSPESLFVKKGRPAVFAGLFANVFTEDNLLLEEPSIESIRCLRQIFRFAKKFRIACPDSAVKERIHDFEFIEQGLIVPVLSWGADSLVCERGYPSLTDVGINVLKTSGGVDGSSNLEAEAESLRILSRIQTIADGFSRHFKFRDEWFRPKHGPGAVSEKFGSSKYEFPSWPRRLELRFPFDKYGIVNHQVWGETPTLDEDRPCKLIGVPKDYKGPRLIASEPICSQFIQQGIMSVIRENVRRSPLRKSIDFRSQEPSRDLVLSASQSGEFSTIDLSSASDRLSCAVVECIFRTKYSFLETLNAARTPEVLLPDGRTVRMKKFAAQGAAFTFPIQSICYALICMGVYSYIHDVHDLGKLAEKVRVFGDDMIVPSDCFHEICKVLELLQLKVNHEKSFHNGSFRESCGMDAYKGQDITPANVLCYYSSRDPNTLVSTVECSNNLYLKGFIHASRVLLETIPYQKRKNLAFKDSVSTVFGVLMPGPNCERGRIKTRWNKYLHRHELLILTVESKVKKSSPDGHSHLFQWFLEEPSALIQWESGEVTSVKARYRLRWVPSHDVRV